MPEQPTPGQCAYEAFWRTFKATFGTHGDETWEAIHPGTQRAWDAAAQAVRMQYKDQLADAFNLEVPLRPWVPQPLPLTPLEENDDA